MQHVINNMKTMRN